MIYLPLDSRNRMLRVGLGLHEGRWFCRVDLWWFGLRFTRLTFQRLKWRLENKLDEWAGVNGKHGS